MRDFRPSVSYWFVLDIAFLCSNYLCFCYHLNICSLTSLVIRVAVSALNLQLKDFFFQFFWGCRYLRWFTKQGKILSMLILRRVLMWLITIFLFPILAEISLAGKVLSIGRGTGDSEMDMLSRRCTGHMCCKLSAF